MDCEAKETVPSKSSQQESPGCWTSRKVGFSHLLPLLVPASSFCRLLECFWGAGLLRLAYLRGTLMVICPLLWKKVHKFYEGISQPRDSCFTVVSWPGSVVLIWDDERDDLRSLDTKGISHPRKIIVCYLTLLLSYSRLSCVQLFATPGTAAHQAHLSSTLSCSLFIFMSTESVMLSNRLILCYLLLLVYPPSQHSRQVAKVLRLQYQSSNKIQSWLALGLTGLISLQSKGLSRVFSSTAILKYRFFCCQPTLWSKSHICTWLLEKP